MRTPAEIRSSILARLQFVYGEQPAPAIFAGIETLLARYAGAIPAKPSGFTQADAFLITYGDSILSHGATPQEPSAAAQASATTPLQTLHAFLRDAVGPLLTLVHLLPFYPFTSDDGFSVTDFRAVRGDLGSWADIEAFARDYRLVFDGVINHVSAESLYMKGFQSGDPRYADFFVALPPDTDTSAVLRTRNLPLLHDYPVREGPNRENTVTQWLWTTFSRDQLDLNYRNPAVLLEIIDVMLFYAQRGAAMVRLDAIPYLWKELGTSCAHLPQTHELIKLFRDIYDLAAPQTALLTETNVPHHENVTYFGDRGDEAQMIYNFTLAPLILWSLHKGDAGTLGEWARGIEWIGPNATYLNITATHDGIGVRPTEGILTHEERMELVQLARDHGGDMTGKRNSDGTVAPYELNITYFDAVNDPRSDEPLALQVRRFLLSQAIPLALMGIPGIYIHSLLGSRNDTEGVKRTGRARSINREQLQVDALRGELANEESVLAQVFREYTRLLALRQKETAFHPDAAQSIPDFGPALFAVLRENAATGERILALHNVTGNAVALPAAALETCGLGGAGLTDILGETLGEENAAAPAVALAPYQVRWLTP